MKASPRPTSRSTPTNAARSTSLPSSPREVTASQLLEAWNSILGDLPLDRLELFDAYRQRYRLYLLSNTNFTHMRRFDRLLQESQGISLDDFRKRSNGVYLSYELGMRKPEADIYEHLLKEVGIRPEASLFIDDLRITSRQRKRWAFAATVTIPGRRLEMSWLKC